MHANLKKFNAKKVTNTTLSTTLIDNEMQQNQTRIARLERSTIITGNDNEFKLVQTCRRDARTVAKCRTCVPCVLLRLGSHKRCINDNRDRRSVESHRTYTGQPTPCTLAAPLKREREHMCFCWRIVWCVCGFVAKVREYP